VPSIPLGFYTVDWVDWWQVLLGFGFVLVTLYAPNGIGGLFDRLIAKGRPMSALLEVISVSVSFDGFKAINDLSFEIGSQELRAVIGPNGAGKTTFMDIVTGKTRPDEGQVRLGRANDGSLLRMSESQIARAGVGRKFQRPTVFEARPCATI
jgi:ABC-type uncharacterized transport system ATPase subunit